MDKLSMNLNLRYSISKEIVVQRSVRKLKSVWYFNITKIITANINLVML